MLNKPCRILIAPLLFSALLLFSIQLPQLNHDNVSYVLSDGWKPPYFLTGRLSNDLSNNPLPGARAMPTFKNTLPANSETKGYDLHRTPPDKPLKGLITSHNLIGCYTHWWGGRTVPCEDSGCEACKNNTPSRWHCYLSICEAGSRDHFIFECTSKAAKPLEEWYAANGTLRGVMLHAHRPKRRRNARVEIILKPFDIGGTILPEPPDLPRAMAVIWQIPGSSVKVEGAVNQTPRIKTDPAILSKQRTNAADGNGKPKSSRKVKV